MTLRGLFIGRSTLDIISVVDGFPTPERTAYSIRQIVIAGGHALNASVTFSQLGGAAELISSVGSGFVGHAILSECEQYSVLVRDLAINSVHMAPVVCIVSDLSSETKTIVLPDTSPMPNNADWYNTIENYDIILLDQFENIYVESILSRLRPLEFEIVLDGGRWKSQSPMFLDICDIPIVSSNFIPPFCSRAIDAIPLLRGGGRSWAITCGSDGVLYEHEGMTGKIDGKKVDVLDTLGAGDVFHGAFCANYARTKNFVESLAFANDIAAESCRYVGAREWAQHLPETFVSART